MKRTIAVLLMLAMATAAAVGCDEVVEKSVPEVAVAAGPPAKGDSAAAPDSRLSSAVNDFGFELARKLAEDGENVVISPLSVAAALSMTHSGARGVTADEMALVLGVGDQSIQEVNQAWADLLASLAQENESTLAVANSLWMDQGASFEQPFLDADRDFFGAELCSLDLQEPGAADAVNEWVDENTNGRIPKIIDSFGPYSVLALVNAVHFNGDWVEQFDPESTDDRPFNLVGGEAADVSMMDKATSWPYVESELYKAVRMDYVGGRYAAYVLVPNGGVTAWDLLGEMDAEEFADMRASLEERQGRVMLPKLEVEWGEGVDLAQQLADMGMHSAFDVTTADFSGMSEELAEEPGLYIGKVLHKTYLRVDEKGTEAAAATVVDMVEGGMAPTDQPFELRADRPFLLMLTDKHSGTVLFLSVIADPRS